jgi:NAD(P)-dependent dehydrogenase (short-subunit alcohol dehydrogenase family)
MKKEKADRRALVVGGSGGIGRAVSRQLLALGNDVVATGAHREKLESLAAEVAEEPGSFLGVQITATQPGEFLSALPEELEPDILVCAYGPVLYKPVGQTTLQEWSVLTGMNLVLPGALVTRYLPGMLDRGFGRILLFGVAGSDQVRGYREIGAYAAAKTGLSVLVSSLAEEMADTGVAVSALLPTYVDTEYLSDDECRRYRGRIGNNRLEKPDEIAETACYLISAKDSRHNGKIVPTR